MKIEEFTLERIQSLYENTVELNYRIAVYIRCHSTTCCPRMNLPNSRPLSWDTAGLTAQYRCVNQSRVCTTIVDRDDVIVTNGSAEANFLR